jgi:hypothetical protein
MKRENEESNTELHQLISDLKQLKLQVSNITRRIEDLKSKSNNRAPIKNKELKVGDK